MIFHNSAPPEGVVIVFAVAGNGLTVCPKSLKLRWMAPLFAKIEYAITFYHGGVGVRSFRQCSRGCKTG
jgi:hypothetical protein